mgnify:CR=1 FL=1
MKPVSINTQKRLLYIPYLNISILFIWLYNCVVTKDAASRVPKTLWIIFSSALPLSILQIIVVSYCPFTGNILAIINAYIIPLVIGHRLIQFQVVL